MKSSIERQQGFYDHLLGTMQSVDLNKNVQQERLSVLQPPTPGSPENRSLVFRIALAFVGGLALSLGIVFLWYLLDDRLVSVRDINDQFGEKVLGLVPQIKVPRAQIPRRRSWKPMIREPLMRNLSGICVPRCCFRIPGKYFTISDAPLYQRHVQ